MTALPSWPQVPAGYVRARDVKAGNRILIGGAVSAEVLSTELRHYFDSGSLIVPSEARIIINVINVYGTEESLEVGLLDPIELIE